MPFEARPVSLIIPMYLTYIWKVHPFVPIVILFCLYFQMSADASCLKQNRLRKENFRSIILISIINRSERWYLELLKNEQSRKLKFGEVLIQ